MRRLPRLDTIVVRGDRLVEDLFAPDFTSDPAYPCLRAVSVILDMKSDRSSTSTLCHNLSRLVGLKKLDISSILGVMPVNLLNLSPSVNLQRRTFIPTHLGLVKAGNLEPEIRHLLQSFSSTLISLRIMAFWSYAAILEDISLLPLSIRHLDLSFGPPSARR
ncbi:hypothetical protein DMC30DRAFT_126494 [Rhodotorula diobovata]|uniref:Uncharacterized protein n=1 Tax=Rhodotorula diobovata TaxID=5288 RepID=A0A5C5FKV2_9BASI|nr:hypothetical protein DMC30DRAFT_126494 [Rhodotorula diobovata]